MSVLSWISGRITDLEKYLAGAEATIKADLAPILANVETEFISAEKAFMAAEYLAFKTIVSKAWGDALAQAGGDLGTAVKLAFEAAVPALESGGLMVAKSAILQFISSLIPLL